jgi:signal transduction histidine kinase/DNA-binding response OmpR family regulator/streptogramin lyase
MNPITGEYIQFDIPEDEIQEIIKNARVTDIVEGPDGSIWVGSWGIGLLRIFPDRQNYTFFQHDDNNPNSLNGNKIKSLEFDEKGYLWIGIEESGLDRLAPEDEVFKHFFNEFQTTDIYEGPSVYNIMIDDQSLMWLGFRNDGVKIVPLHNPSFHKYSNNEKDKQIFSICETSKGIYLGAKGSIDLFNQNTKQFTSYPLPNNETPIALYDYGKSTILVGTYKGSLLKFHTISGQFSNLSTGHLDEELQDLKIECFYALPDEKILIGTQKGLYKLDLEDQSYKKILSPWIHAIKSGENESIWCMSWGDYYQYFPQTGKLLKHDSDAQGDIKSSYFSPGNDKVYLGTDLGFYVQELASSNAKRYRDVFPFINNQVNDIQVDNQNNFWITSESGLINYNPTEDKFKTFSEADGLPKIRFYDGVGAKLSDGKIAFGGDKGILIFDPRKIEDRKNNAQLTFTDITILNETSSANNSSLPFDKDISELEVLNLKYRQNIITFNFSLLSYINPNKHRYQYLLEGFNENWFDLGNQNSVTFTNLDPGHYTLKIKAANEENNWGPVEELKIHVSPPLSRTWYAYTFYVIVLASIYLFIRQFYKNREKLKSRLKDEHMNFEKIKAKAKHESEFSQMRLKFFTNISHEFRTPLTLILGPLENFMKNKKWPSEDHLKLMHKNAERLQRLITQILDFRSMESKNLKFEASWGDVVGFVKETALLFSPMAQQKNLNFQIISHSESLFSWFDRDKLEKIIFNLLSNAFKHTQKGNVSIDISDYDPETLPYKSKRWNSEEYEKYLEIIVKDSGNGIPEDKIRHIFDRFFHLQMDNNTKIQGTGIGLALTKELVNLQNGKIFASSKVNEGSTFHVIIPLKTQNHEVNGPEKTDLLNVDDIESLSLNIRESSDNAIGEPAGEEVSTILIVEDNEDLREYMNVEFGKKYNLIEAENGKVGLDKAFDIIPDLIISDLIMPEMDGIEFCKEIKKDQRTSHIPIIILTAHGSHFNKVQGYEIGADDYVTKPFSSDLLSLRIENLLKNRKDLQSKFSREVRLQPKDLPISSMDERFLTKAMEVVEENLNNSDFNADSFASEMCMSRVHLYRKLKALTDQSVSDFVKTARLKLAANLIGKNKLTIKEAAYTVGFKDPKYFSKCFKQQFGVKPSEYHEVTLEDE